MEKRRLVAMIGALILVIVLSACGGSTTKPSNESVAPDSEGLPPVAAVKAREVLAAELKIGIEDATIVSHVQKTWSDSCLGLGGATESCLKAEVDGWLVELTANGETYKARTDWLGDQVRFEP